MQKIPEFSIHALRRISEKVRTQLNEEDIIEILKKRGCVTLFTDNEFVEHILLYSMKDKDFYILLIAQDSSTIKTILPLYMYGREVKKHYLVNARSIALKRMPRQTVLFTAQIQDKSNNISFRSLGALTLEEYVSDLNAWSLCVSGKETLAALIRERIAGKDICLRLYARFKKAETENPLVEISVP